MGVMSITRVSVDGSGTQGNESSSYGSLSPDGTKVIFTSTASNLVAGDTNGVLDVFVKDLSSGTLTRVSTDSSGNQSSGGTTAVTSSFTPDSAHIVFYSYATNLVASDTNAKIDVFLKDLSTNSTTRISTTSAGAQANGNSPLAFFDSTGSKLFFVSEATNLGGDSDTYPDTYSKDLSTGTVTLLSTNSSGTKGNFGGVVRGVSSDGTKICLESSSSNLIASDTNGFVDVFVKNLSTGAVTLVSNTSAGVQGNNASAAPWMSDDATKVTYISYASNLVTGDTNGVADVFLKDLGTGTTSLISANEAGTIGNGASTPWDISKDGTKVLFSSNATNLVSGDTDGVQDLFVRDLVTGGVILVAAGSQGEFSDDGRKIILTSGATNLVAGDTNGKPDVFIATIGDREGKATADSISGGSGNEILNGNAGNDFIQGGTGTDTINGGDDNDSLRGGNDNDVLNGDAGNDTLHGDNGADTLTGGGGADYFSYSDLTYSVNGTKDLITDFVQGTDKIDLSGQGLSFGALTITSGGGITTIDDNGSTFAVDLTGTYTLVAGDFIF